MRQLDFYSVAGRQFDIAFEQQARSGDIVDLDLKARAVMPQARGEKAEFPARVEPFFGAGRRWQEMSENRHMRLLVPGWLKEG
ncbi:hypothetical protein [Sphingopyxis sp. H053]|uniref:hypothetical protein n=1 Tax=Sphingopyxis sp. H053 TaxID=1759067 RepID=UPI001E58A667|nr:hypothetical protein [Sphingopyxis sp. H053]